MGRKRDVRPSGAGIRIALVALLVSLAIRPESADDIDPSAALPKDQAGRELADRRESETTGNPAPRSPGSRSGAPGEDLRSSANPAEDTSWAGSGEDRSRIPNPRESSHHRVPADRSETSPPAASHTPGPDELTIAHRSPEPDHAHSATAIGISWASLPPAMADQVRTLARRDTQGLHQVETADGATHVQIRDRFQSVPVAVIDANGTITLSEF